MTARPRFVALSMVKNEQDIIEPFVRHTLAYADYLYVIDNDSVDDTRAILTALMRETVRLFVAHFSRPAYTQSLNMSRLLRYAQAAFHADFLSILDADEFIEASSAEAFHAALDTIPPGGQGLLTMRHFTLHPDDAVWRGEPPDPPRGIRHVRRDADPGAKAVLRLDGAWRDDIDVAQGNYFFYNPAGPLPSVPLPGLSLAHFPVRHAAQLNARAVVGWMAYLYKDPAVTDPWVGHHWRDAFRAAMDRPQTEPLDVCLASLNHGLRGPGLTDFAAATEPATPPEAYLRRYSGGAPLHAVALIGLSWQSTILTAARLTGFQTTDSTHTDLPPMRMMIEKYDIASATDVVDDASVYAEYARHLGTFAPPRAARPEMALCLSVTERPPSPQAAASLVARAAGDARRPVRRRHTRTAPRWGHCAALDAALARQRPRARPRRHARRPRGGDAALVQSRATRLPPRPVGRADRQRRHPAAAARRLARHRPRRPCGHDLRAARPGLRRLACILHQPCRRPWIASLRSQ